MWTATASWWPPTAKAPGLRWKPQHARTTSPDWRCWRRRARRAPSSCSNSSRFRLDEYETPPAERAEQVAMQQRIIAAVLEDETWDGVPDALRQRADTPWFRSFLAFDPARAARRTRQPVLLLHGKLDTQIPVAHADRMAGMLEARRRDAAVEIARLPGIDHRPARRFRRPDRPVQPVARPADFGRRRGSARRLARSHAAAKALAMAPLGALFATRGLTTGRWQSATARRA